MSIFKSTSWTGRAESDAPEVPVAIMERPAIQSAKLVPKPAEPKREEYLAEYAALAETVGIMPPDLGIEAFTAFLRQNDMPVFALAQVVAYMDDKAAKESKDKAGWEWRPLRERDHRPMQFGRPAERGHDQYGSRSLGIVIAASDYYSGPQEHDAPEFVFQGGQHMPTGRTIKRQSPASQSPYDKTIPLHALRKVAAIDKAFGGNIALFVCDYALAPAIEHPDPFLMAVVNNSRINIGAGRFIIDFWDEPGFGLDRMLK